MKPRDHLGSPPTREKLVININDDGILLSNVQASVSVQLIDARQTAFERGTAKGENGKF